MSHPKICETCKKPFEADKKSRRFCSYACSAGSKKIEKQEAICEHCGNTFRVKRAYLYGAAKFCSRACYLEVARAYKFCPQCGVKFFGPNDVYCSAECVSKSQRKRITTMCEHCGKEFEAKLHVIERNWGTYCSRECARAAQVAQRVEIFCEVCGNTFSVIPSQLNYRTPRFCSFPCYRKYSGETTPEKLIRGALMTIGIFFEQEYPALNYSLDFYLPMMSVDLEVDGDYWHKSRGTHDQRRDADLIGIGITTVRIKESEILASKDVTKLVKKRLHL